MTNHEETAKRLLPCMNEIAIHGCFMRDGIVYHDRHCPAYYRPAVASALAEAEAKGADRLNLALGDARKWKACWDAACHDIAKRDAEIARLKADAEADEQGLLEIMQALDGISTSGEMTGPKSREYIGPAEQIKKLRTKLAEAERERDAMRKRWQRMSDLAGHNLDERERLTADRDAARAEIENIKTVEFPRRIEKISKGCLAKGRREGLERAKERIEYFFMFKQAPEWLYSVIDAEIARLKADAEKMSAELTEECYENTALRRRLAEAERERDAFGRCVSDTTAVLSAKIEEVARDRDAAYAKAERLEKQLTLAHANEACDCTYLREVDSNGDQIVIPCEIHKAHDEKLIAKGRREGLERARELAKILTGKQRDDFARALEAEIAKAGGEHADNG